MYRVAPRDCGSCRSEIDKFWTDELDLSDTDA